MNIEEEKRVVITIKQRVKNGRFSKAKTLTLFELLNLSNFRYAVESKPSVFDKMFNTKRNQEIKAIELKNEGIQDFIESLEDAIVKVLK